MASVVEAAGEEVVLLDEDGRAIGTADKRAVHHRDTPLHLAFSCYLFDGAGRFLLTQRAHDKVTWPGVWTNSCCGHPGPGEDIEDAVRRRVRQELGVRIKELRLVLPRFRYRSVMADGVVENELCPVFVATTTDEVRPDPAEVASAVWESWPELRLGVLDGSRDIAPWCHEQMAELPEDPLAADTRPRDELPPAAR